MDNNELKERLERIKRGDNVNTPEPEQPSAEELLEKVDYKEAIKRDMDNLSDEEFNATRKQAFEQVKDDLTERVTGERPKTAAEIYEEKNSTIKITEKKEVVPEPDLTDPGESLLGSLDKLDEDSAHKAAILAEEQKKYEEEKMKEASPEESGSGQESVDDILAAIEDSNTKRDLELEEDTDDLALMLEKLEGQKQYASYTPSEEYTGPASYVIDKSEDYEESVEDILVSNDINIIKKSSNAERTAILNKLTNSGNTVTVPLVNSGIYITVSGGSVTEIIAMNDINETGTAAILAKLDIINNHIVDSSIGKMRLSQLIKVVSYYDIETLYYAFYAATYPENSEINRRCSKCNQEYFINMNTKDMLRNPEDFIDEAVDIRNNVTTFEILKSKSLLNKIIKKQCVNGNIIVNIMHPSIESYVRTMNVINMDVMNKYPGTIVDMVYSIDKLYVRKAKKDYIEISDPNVIIDIISKIKDVNLKFELLDMIEEIRPYALPSYGYKATVCPNCGYKDESTPFQMDDLLFTHAQQEDEMATLRWAAKLQKRRQSKKK